MRFFQIFKELSQKFSNDVYEVKKSKDDYVPPVQIVILNRGYDLLSPFLNDITYSGLHYAMNKVDHNKLNYQMELENEGFINKTSYLNEQDPVWRNLRYEPLFENMKKLSQSY